MSGKALSKLLLKGAKSKELIMKVGGTKFFETNLPRMDALLRWDLDYTKIEEKDLVEVPCCLSESREGQVA